VVFGDSLASGNGASPGGDIASQLATKLDREVINLGVPGNTTADGLARVGALVSLDPRVVVVILGGNDTLQRVPVVNTFANLASIIERIQEMGAAVVLVGAPGGLYGKQYDKEYARLAKEYRTFYVPNILSGLIGRPEYMSDYIHPNDVGYAIAADRILPEVERALGVR
jgi:acyl-CoA thioesterase-1